jgi:hypothetical protein
MTTEQIRLTEAREQNVPWKKRALAEGKQVAFAPGIHGAGREKR